MVYADLIASLADSAPLSALVILFLYAGLSCIAAGLSTLWTLGQWKGYARFGLWNLLTLAAVWFAVRYSPGERAASLRKANFVGVFTRVFVLATLAAQDVVLLPLGSVAGSFIAASILPFLAVTLSTIYTIRGVRKSVFGSLGMRRTP